jgi:hypothetical protein
MSKMNESHNNPKTRNSKHKENVAHTMSLVRVLFEDFGTAINIHEQAKDIHDTHSISPLILLNDGFKFEREIVSNKEYNGLEKEWLKSFESLCVFGYREYYKNLLCILVEFYYRVSGKATPVPKPMMEIFDLFNQPLINHMMQRGKFEKQVLPHSYKLVTNKSELIVSYTNTRPVQFDLCTLPSADTFIDKQGSGWNENNSGILQHDKYRSRRDAKWKKPIYDHITAV